MGIIHTLSSFEAQKIAAGEVVERPYNIVKELLENSLDAGATQISLYVQDGGRKSIRCIDNGCGMTQEDAHMCVAHHATSKLTKIEDLETLQTFGFRGEALSSICSVSTLTLATHMRQDTHGVKLTYEFGTLKESAIISQSPGTDITISTIFDNVPARKKFLKTRETEWRAIVTLVQAIALAHKHVAFILYHDNQQVLTTYATDSLKERVAQLFERSFSEKFLECSADTGSNGTTITGGITHYQYQRYDRNQQFFFVNKRWVKNYKLSHAFNKGFQKVMPPQRHPAGVIFIEVPQRDVDINVHPRKEEVVFLNPRLIELAVEKMVQQTLERETAQRVAPEMYTAPLVNHHNFRQAVSEFPTAPTVYQSARTFSPLKEYTPDHSFDLQHQVQTTGLQEKEPAYTILGQLLKTYLLVETEEGLLLVDQHAAHEAVLYEQFSSTTNQVVRIQLIFPEIISVKAEDQKILLASIAELNRLGIHIESASENAIAVTETPLHIKNYPLKELVHDILAWIHEDAVATQETWHKRITKKFHAMMACKAAVKAGDELSITQIKELLNSLYTTEHRLTCPHGRPTTWVISRYELEKNFKRS